MKMDALSAPAPLEAALISYSEFPVGDLREQLADILFHWMAKLAGQWQLRPVVFLQGSALHTAEEVNRLTDRAAEWMPNLGLGVRPTDPPRLLQESDLAALQWDQFPKPRHESLFLLTEERAAFESAFPLYCGSGALMCCLMDSPLEAYLTAQRKMWLPKIEDRAFQAHPFYAPLLRPSDLREGYFEQTWMGSVRVYLRESVEDNGLFLITADTGVLPDLQSALERLLLS